MIKDYSQIISKLVLYLGAGMTLRGIFEKLCVDYEKSLQRGLSKRYAYEEIRVMVNELRAGESESRAYQAPCTHDADAWNSDGHHHVSGVYVILITRSVQVFVWARQSISGHYRGAWYINIFRAVSRVMNPGFSIWTFIF